MNRVNAYSGASAAAKMKPKSFWELQAAANSNPASLSQSQTQQSYCTSNTTVTANSSISRKKLDDVIEAKRHDELIQFLRDISSRLARLQASHEQLQSDIRVLLKQDVSGKQNGCSGNPFKSSNIIEQSQFLQELKIFPDDDSSEEEDTMNMQQYFKSKLSKRSKCVPSVTQSTLKTEAIQQQTAVVNLYNDYSETSLGSEPTATAFDEKKPTCLNSQAESSWQMTEPITLEPIFPPLGKRLLPTQQLSAMKLSRF